MKKTKIIYWTITGLFALFMFAAAIPDIFSTPEAIAFVKGIGYPVYLLPFLGIAKVLGVLAILISGFPKIKEWAYAGLLFDLIGAAYSNIASGASANSMPALIAIVLCILSYVFYHKKLHPISLNIQHLSYGNV
jgi:hypothetical protein